MQYHTQMLIFIFSAIIIVALIAITWPRRSIPIGQAFILLMLLSLIWTVGFFLEIAVHSLNLKVLMVKLQFIGIAFIPLAWLYLIITYIGHVRLPKGWIFLFIIPSITNLLIWLIPRPNWFWGNVKLVAESKSFPVVDYDYGAWFYYIHAPFSYILLFFALFLLLRRYFNMQPIYRNQIMIMIIAVLLPTITDISYVLGFSPIKNINLTTAMFSISGLIITWALFRYKFLDLLPMARDIVFENMDDGVIVLDNKNRILDVNCAGKVITGISAQEIGKDIWEIASEPIRNAISKMSGDLKQMEIKLSLPNIDDIRIFDLRLSSIKDQIGQVQGSVLTLRDITERSNLFEQIQRQAIHDSLTGIFNRRQLIKLGETEIERVKRHPDIPISVIIMDIDRFKSINDKYGHGTGDLVLKTLAQRCNTCFRSYDIFGRLGGDEFAAILPETTAEEAIIVAERIVKTVKEMQVATVQGNVSITVSLGVAASTDLASSEIELEWLLNLADELMYHSKQRGGNMLSQG